MTFSNVRRSRNRRRMILMRRQEMMASVTGHSSLDYVRSAMGEGKPLNWVITGERYEVENSELTIGESLARDLRTVFDRDDDTIFDSTQRGDRMIAVEMSLEHRALRYDPHVVVLCVGADDPRIEQRIAECQAFGRVLDQLGGNDAAVVVIPPPAFVGQSNDPRLNRWRDDIVELTHARNAILIPTAQCRQITAVAAQVKSLLLRPLEPGDSRPARPSKPVVDILPLVR